MTERKRRAAYHEAGYAVVAWAFDLPTAAMRLGGRQGAHRLPHADHLTNLEQLALCYAGLAGGSLSGDVQEEGEGACDIEIGEEVLKSGYARNDPVLRDKLRSDGRLLASEIVHELSDLVILLAVRLMLSDMTAAEVVELLERDLDDDPPAPTLH